MENTNSTAPAEVTKLTAKALFNKDEVKAKFQEMLGKRSTSFITSVLQIVASNKYLQNADPNSIYHSAAVAATLDLPLNAALGFACIVPYNESYKDQQGNWQKRQVAQFQIMAKGFKQLALRSGQFVVMNVTDVREGEIKDQDRLRGYIEFTWEKDDVKRRALPIVGYVSYFELLNGYSKTLYMTVQDLRDHAQEYSQTYQQKKGKWVDDFDAMCRKTVIKLNLSKDAPLSVDMQRAMIADQAVIKDSSDTLEVDYVDNENSAQLDEPPVTHEQLMKLMEEKMGDLTKKEFDDFKRILDNKEENSYKKVYTQLMSKSNEQSS
jgi:recombination protein RecT